MLLLKIASYLDPSTYGFLTCDDKKEAEAILCNEAKVHYEKLKSKSVSSSHQSAITTSSNQQQQDKQSNSLQNLFITCGVPLQSTITTWKQSTIKEEIARYVATINQHKSFSQYWNKNKDQLPILSSIVQHYNIICATSITGESAFSIAGFL